MVTEPTDYPIPNARSDYETFSTNPEVKIKFEQDFYGIQLSANKTNNIPTFLQCYNETSTTEPNLDLTKD